MKPGKALKTPKSYQEYIEKYLSIINDHKIIEEDLEELSKGIIFRLGTAQKIFMVKYQEINVSTGTINLMQMRLQLCRDHTEQHPSKLKLSNKGISRSAERHIIRYNTEEVNKVTENYKI